MSEKLNLDDFIPLLEKAESNTQIKALVDCFDTCWNDDKEIVQDDNDWVRLSHLIAEIKKN